MSLPPLATVAALEPRIGVPVGSLAGDDLTRAVEALADASALVRDEGLPWVDEDGETITAPDAVIVVVLRAARREYLNPEELSNESVGPYSNGRAREAASVYLTAGEVAIIRRAAGKTAGGSAMSIRTPSAYASPPPPSDPVVLELP
ncbi:hypothetical protein AB0J27_20255 [Micromonospora chokoriensis]